MAPFFFDPDALAAIAADHASDDGRADPFPHAVLHDVVPDAVVHPLVTEFPGPDAIDWKRPRDSQQHTLGSEREVTFGPDTLHPLAQCNGFTFVDSWRRSPESRA